MEGEQTLFEQDFSPSLVKRFSANHLEHIQQMKDERLEHVREHNYEKAANLKARISGTFHDRRGE